MLLTPHALSGMAFADQVDNIFISVFLVILSYFILEFVPHWDPENNTNQRANLVKVLDFGFTILSFGLVILYKFLFLESDLDLNFFIGGVVALILYFMFHYPPKLFGMKVYIFVSQFHKSYKRVDRSIWGMTIHVAVSIIAIAFLLGQVTITGLSGVVDQFIDRL